jgi:SP family galactose:H+ symporter-like MFS transporter
VLNGEKMEAIMSSGRNQDHSGVPAPAALPDSNGPIIYVISAIAALGGLLFGYDTGVISGALLFLTQDFHLSATQQELAVSSALIGALLGALSAAPMNDALGRRRALFVLSVIFFAGALITALSPSYTFLVISRVIVGFAFGAAASIVPVYISEVAPVQLRGKLVTFNQLAITIGIAVSYGVDLVFANAGLGWRPMFAAAAIPSMLLFIGLFFVPETPRWFAIHGRWEEAQASLVRLDRTPQEIELEIVDIQQSGLQEKGSFRELLRPEIRLALLVGVGLAVFQQLVGINTVIYYAPTIFQSAGIGSASAAILATSIVGMVNVISTIVASLVMDKFGRRPLLLWGAAVMTVALIILGAIFAIGPSRASTFVLFALFLYIIAFAMSFGPVFWLMSAELFPTSVRAAGSSVSSFANWTANLLVSITFLSLVGAIGTSGAFWFYAVMGVFAFIFCLALVPETKNKSLEQIEYYWQHDRHWGKPAPVDAGSGD